MRSLDTPAGAIAMIAAFALGFVMLGVTVGLYAAPWFVVAVGVVGVVVIVLAIRAIARGGRLPTDQGLAFIGIIIGVIVIILLAPMVVTALVTHWQEIPAGWWKLHLLENRDVIYRSLPW